MAKATEKEKLTSNTPCVRRYNALQNEEDEGNSLPMVQIPSDSPPDQNPMQMSSDNDNPKKESAQKCILYSPCIAKSIRLCISSPLKFILGVWEPTRGCKWICRILSSSVSVIMLLASTATVSIYLACFFGRMNHLLLLLSFVSYWLSVMSPQIICTVAIIWNFWIQLFPNDINEEDVHSERVFHGKYISKHFQVKIKVFLLYAIFGPVLITLKSLLTSKIPKECKSWHDIMSMINEALNIIFYTLFCYFLYLQRIALEKEGYDCFEYIRDNFKELTDCKKYVVTVFQGYKRLRQVLIPWVWIVLFCSSFGMTAGFTWNYDRVPQSTLSPPMEKSDDSWCAHVTCDQIPFLLGSKNGRFYLNINVLFRNFMTAGFALHVVYGSDLKHVWDTFRLRLFTIYSDENKHELQEILKFMDCMYPGRSAD